MSYAMDRERAAAVVELALDAGLRVFLAERGTYGYITNVQGSRVMTFGADLGGITYSGCYRPGPGAEARNTGSGWQLARDAPTTREAMGQCWDRIMSLPNTCTVFGNVVIMLTEDEHCARYQDSSRYVEVTA